MSGAIESLFDYAQKHLMPEQLCQDEAYLASRRCAERQEELVRAALDKEGERRLIGLMDELELVQFARVRAAFLCGFRLAAELERA